MASHVGAGSVAIAQGLPDITGRSLGINDALFLEPIEDKNISRRIYDAMGRC